MTMIYDICVDYDTLQDTGRKLQHIGNSLHKSAVGMEQALRYSQDFLSGEQYERARHTTETCLKIAGRTENNIRYSLEYIKDLLQLLEEYQRCIYSGGKK